MDRPETLEAAPQGIGRARSGARRPACFELSEAFFQFSDTQFKHFPAVGILAYRDLFENSLASQTQTFLLPKPCSLIRGHFLARGG